jgi:hypothetical protein
MAFFSDHARRNAVSAAAGAQHGAIHDVRDSSSTLPQIVCEGKNESAEHHARLQRDARATGGALASPFVEA